MQEAARGGHSSSLMWVMWERERERMWRAEVQEERERVYTHSITHTGYVASILSGYLHHSKYYSDTYSSDTWYCNFSNGVCVFNFSLRYIKSMSN